MCFVCGVIVIVSGSGSGGVVIPCVFRSLSVYCVYYLYRYHVFCIAPAILEIFENVSELLLSVYMVVEVEECMCVRLFVSDWIASQCVLVNSLYEKRILDIETEYNSALSRMLLLSCVGDACDIIYKSI